MAQAIMQPTSILEVSLWILDQDTDCYYRYSSWSSSVAPEHFRDRTLNLAIIASFHIFFSNSFLTVTELLEATYSERERESRSYFTTDGLPPISSSWGQAP
jgi:hypothetical protein